MRQALDDVVNARQIIATDRLSAVSGERDLVGERVGNEIQDGGEGERHQHSALAAESTTSQHQQQRHAGEQECVLEYAAHGCCLSFLASIDYMPAAVLWALPIRRPLTPPSLRPPSPSES